MEGANLINGGIEIIIDRNPYPYGDVDGVVLYDGDNLVKVEAKEKISQYTNNKCIVVDGIKLESAIRNLREYAQINQCQHEWGVDVLEQIQCEKCGEFY